MDLLNLLYILCALGCAVWSAVFLRISYSLARVVFLKDVDLTPPATWPKLTVIVAACDEQDTIQKAMTSLLATDYPNLEFICVNDRSSDQTGRLMEELAADMSNVQIVHINELPSGWIGKTHAMHSAVQHASGDWILFTDADVHFSKDALTRSMAHALAEGTDHLTLYPEVRGDSFWYRVTVRAFTWFYLTRFKVERMTHASNRSYAGYGGFNLIRKKALDTTPGLEWLKMDVVDDIGLGLMLHNAGGKSLFAMGHHAIGVEWYPSLPAMFRGLAKNTFGAVAHYSILKTICMSAGSLLLQTAPLVAIAVIAGPTWLRASGILYVVTFLFVSLLYKVRSPRESLFISFLLPVGMFLLTLISVYSMIVCVRDDGVTWRGTHYSLDQLRKNQRLKL